MLITIKIKIKCQSKINKFKFKIQIKNFKKTISLMLIKFRILRHKNNNLILINKILINLQIIKFNNKINNSSNFQINFKQIMK